MHACYETEGIGERNQQALEVLRAHAARGQQRQQPHGAQAAQYGVEEDVAANRGHARK